METGNPTSDSVADALRILHDILLRNGLSPSDRAALERVIQILLTGKSDNTPEGN